MGNPGGRGRVNGRLSLQAAARGVSLPPWMRTALFAATVVAVMAAACATTATAASSPWVAYLAPASACPGADDINSPPQAQKQAMLCLVNWTRRHVGLRRLRWSRVLANAAGSKADVIAHCGDFSHHPCGTRWPAAAIRRTPFNTWGENLFYGTRSISSPRAALLAWLESPEHRALLFDRVWRALGVTVHHARSLGGNPGVSIWVLEVAGRS
ncbi:MAG: CAP domain-containing protein [Actinobacteria bacterium]|nr:MAG: CAP domain-containing protein [Actinomycetota bacterium]